ncbi:hypothetical protein O6P43_014031 [Quillaja saponaria]|uniref:Uncharacterized protein n=1 Tax=Quillaja saponaria TaxID=32244 RepID=A0AAD7LVF4_QUISA|nr:hypothetical protein O6P43_014031 [Quillaja saponaria]
MRFILLIQLEYPDQVWLKFISCIAHISRLVFLCFGNNSTASLPFSFFCNRALFLRGVIVLLRLAASPTSPCFCSLVLHVSSSVVCV